MELKSNREIIAYILGIIEAQSIQYERETGKSKFEMRKHLLKIAKSEIERKIKIVEFAERERQRS